MHKCPSILALVALTLATHKELSAHTATYDGIKCPMCRKVYRTTRLASSIHTLKHELHWDIETDRGEAVQANYIVHKVGEMPKMPAVVKDNLDRWVCLGYKRTPKGPGTRPKNFITHGIEYPNQPDQRSTTDAANRWAWGHCMVCGQVTMWEKRPI